MLKPLSHLLDILLLVCRPICHFCIINVESLRTFHAVSICRSKGDHGLNVVVHRMEFRDIKVGAILAHILINKVLQIIMKWNPGSIKFAKRIQCMGFKVGIVYEVEGSANDVYETGLSRTCKNTKEDFLHILVFSANPLQDKGDSFLEML